MEKNIENFINKIFNEDCLDTMNRMPDNSIDLIVTSPPYNCGIQYENYDDKIEWKKYYLWCKKWIEELYRILKQDGRCCIIHYLSLGNSDNRHAPLMKINTIAEGVGFKHYGLAI